MKVEFINANANANAWFLLKNSLVETFLCDSFSEDKNKVVSVYGLVFCGDLVLFTQEKDTGHPDIDIPGGHIEKGETYEQAIQREVYEETGVAVNTFSLLGFNKCTISNPPDNYKYPTPESFMLLYVAQIDVKVDTSLSGVWFSVEEARTIPWVNENRALFEAMYQESKYLRGDFEKSFLDVYDETGIHILDTKSYDTVHRQGLWHKGVHVWILNDDNKFIIQKRGAGVQTKPNILESAAAGHVNHGHTSIQTVIEECKEEIGVVVSEIEIEYVGTFVDQFEEMGGVIKNNEFDEVYIIKKNVQVADIIFEKKEVSEVLCIDAKEYLERAMGGDPTIAYRPEEYTMVYKYLYGK